MLQFTIQSNKVIVQLKKKEKEKTQSSQTYSTKINFFLVIINSIIINMTEKREVGKSPFV
jgi:hypothetical protein